jgi:hypothetical protein
MCAIILFNDNIVFSEYGLDKYRLLVMVIALV